MGIARAFALLLALAVLAAACGDDSSSPSPSPPSTPATQRTAPTVLATTAPPPAAPSARCEDARPHPAGDDQRTLTSGGLQRSYILHVPPQYNGTVALPLVLNFHGYGSNAQQQHRYARFPALADAEGFVVVTPDATGARQQWNTGAISTSRADDIAFISDLLDALGRELCIDAARVYAAGISNGSAFAQRLACALPGRIAAIGAVAVVVAPRGCARPVPIIAFHGTEDACVPYDGGTVTCGPVPVPIAPMEDGLAAWARLAGCEGGPSETETSANVRLIAYEGCPGGTALLYRIEGGGHTWPGSVGVARLGATTDEIDATALMWQFFSRWP